MRTPGVILAIQPAKAAATILMGAYTRAATQAAMNKTRRIIAFRWRAATVGPSGL